MLVTFLFLTTVLGTSLLQRLIKQIIFSNHSYLSICLSIKGKDSNVIRWLWCLKDICSHGVLYEVIIWGNKNVTAAVVSASYMSLRKSSFSLKAKCNISKKCTYLRQCAGWLPAWGKVASTGVFTGAFLTSSNRETTQLYFKDHKNIEVIKEFNPLSLGFWTIS